MFKFFQDLLPPFDDSRQTTLPNDFVGFLWACARDARRYVAATILLTALIAAFEASLFAVMGRLVDWLAKTDPSQLWTEQRNHLLLLCGVLAASMVLIAFQSMVKQQSLSGNLLVRLQWSFHHKMLEQSASFYQGEFAGKVAAKVIQTAFAVRDVLVILADFLVYSVIYFVTIALVVGHLHPALLLAFISWLIMYLTVVVFFVPRLAAVSKEQADARSVVTGRISDIYTNIVTVKLFSYAPRESVYVRGALSTFLHAVYRQMRIVTIFEIVNHALIVALIAVTAGVTLWLWTQGRAGTGAVATATAMALRLNGISQWAMWQLASLFDRVGTVQDGMSMLTRLPTVRDRPDAPELHVSRGEIRFEGLTFSYSDDSTGVAPAIDNFDLHVRPGEKIGLVGRSGAGKSTLVNLLLRFYDIRQGKILIDGQDIALVSQNSLRAQIGMVTQDTSLLHRSIAENILYGRPDAGENAMIAAAKQAEAHEFILSLKDFAERRGYNAYVGERGLKLSGGQRQRIAIARVMLKNAPILLLDEATSALDSEVEAAIQQNLYQLMAGKTVIAIAHRLSTIAAMDRLIVLDNGRVVEEGNHDYLLSQRGLYARLWAHQSGGFLGIDADVPGFQ